MRRNTSFESRVAKIVCHVHFNTLTSSR